MCCFVFIKPSFSFITFLTCFYERFTFSSFYSRPSWVFFSACLLFYDPSSFETVLAANETVLK